MRISDWSSDVCSSDLRLEIIETRIAGHDRRRLSQRHQHVAIAAQVAERRRLVDQRSGVARIGGERPVVPAERRGQPLLVTDQIRLERERGRSEEHTSELQSLMRISYAVFCLKKKKKPKDNK